MSPRTTLWLQWVLANALAEGVGLGGSLALGALLFGRVAASQRISEVLVGALAAVLLGTFFEGVFVGVAQAIVLRRWIPSIRARAWAAATAAGAGVAWTLGMLPSTVLSLVTAGEAQPAPPPETSFGVVIALAAGMGLVLGVILALPQWWVLRRHVRGAALWIPANALAWMCGLPLTFIGPRAIPPEGVTAPALAAIGASVIAAGAIVGAIHGAALVRLAAPGARAAEGAMIR